MEWSDDAILLTARRHGDSSVVAEVLTRSHGRHLGLVRGGRSRSLSAVLQTGNSVAVVWRSRLADHLGQFTLEPLRLRAAGLIETAEVLFAVQVLTAHLHLLPERQSNPRLYETAQAAFEIFAADPHPDLPELCAFLARFELLLLQELGFGLDLTRCAATGSTDDLAYVSPRTGRAVCRLGAAGYEAKLLPLPPFLQEGGRSNRGPAELAEGLRLTGHFLARELYAARSLPMPSARDELIGRLLGQNETTLAL